VFAGRAGSRQAGDARLDQLAHLEHLGQLALAAQDAAASGGTSASVSAVRTKVPPPWRLSMMPCISARAAPRARGAADAKPLGEFTLGRIWSPGAHRPSRISAWICSTMCS